MRIFFLTLLILLIIIIMQSEIVKCGKKMSLIELKQMMTPMSKSCKSKTGVSDEMVAACQRGEFPKVRPLMCYFKCLITMMKVMNKQGQVSLKVLNTQIDTLVLDELAPRLKEIGKTCIDSVPFNEDSCEYAYDIILCGFNIDSEMYFLP